MLLTEDICQTTFLYWCAVKKYVCRVNMPIEIIVGALSCIYSVCFAVSKSCWTGPRVIDLYSAGGA